MSGDIVTGNDIEMKLDMHGNPIPVFGWDHTGTYALRALTSAATTQVFASLASGIYKIWLWEDPVLVETDVRIHYNVDEAGDADANDPIIPFMVASADGPDHDEASAVIRVGSVGSIRLFQEGITTVSTGIRIRLVRLL